MIWSYECGDPYGDEMERGQKADTEAMTAVGMQVEEGGPILIPLPINGLPLTEAALDIENFQENTRGRI